MTCEDILLLYSTVNTELRITVIQKDSKSFRELIEITKTLPKDPKQNINIEITLDKLFKYLSSHPNSEKRSHFKELKNLSIFNEYLPAISNTTNRKLLVD